MRVQRGKEWDPAVVAAVHKSPRSYEVQQGSQTLLKNSRHLRASKEPRPRSTPGRDDLDEIPPYQDQDSSASVSADDQHPEPQESSIEPLNKPHKPYVTASGRVVRKPVKYRDYV